MPSNEAQHVEDYMRSEAERFASYAPEEFVLGLRETVDRIFLSKENKKPDMHSVLSMAAGVSCQPVSVQGIECEWVLPDSANDPNRIRMLYLHGGGLGSGSCNTHRALVSRLAKRIGASILVPDYSLAPENPFPAAFEETASLFNWIAENGPTRASSPQRLFAAGDSAGGGLLVSALSNQQSALKLMPDAIATLSMLCDFTASSNSMETNRPTDVFISKEAILAIAAVYSDGQDPGQPKISPIFGDLKGLPPMHIQASRSETLLDDSTRLYEAHIAAGGEGEINLFDGMVHVWHSFSPYLPEAEKALDDLSNFFKKYMND